MTRWQSLQLALLAVLVRLATTLFGDIPEIEQG